ncbi:MAG: transcriptional regulator, GntR family [Glaciihabitans sp.]|nr:transcriptional regulator, GntR family [Glaciihabitans sp.]
MVYTYGMPRNPGGTATGRDKAYRYLTEHVLIDPTLQGTFLNEQDLAERIGVSRTPVREALLLLASDNLITMVPQRGAQIPVITGRQISELMELRAVLERHAATVVIERGVAPVTEMRDALDHQAAMVGQPPSDTGREFIEWDRTFHQTLVNASANDLISRSYAKLGARQVLVGVEALFRTGDRQQQVCDEHGAILAALEAGDAAAAREAIDRHLSVTLDLLLRN